MSGVSKFQKFFAEYFKGKILIFTKHGFVFKRCVVNIQAINIILYFHSLFSESWLDYTQFEDYFKEVCSLPVEKLGKL